MIIDIIFSLIFIFSIYYLIRNRLNMEKSIEWAPKATFPSSSEDFQAIVIPTEWKEMEPLTKETRSYKFVRWGTVITIILLTIILYLILATDILGTSFFSAAYLFAVILSAVRFPGNFYIVENGIILNGRFFLTEQIEHFEVEKIVRWHDLYGLNDKLNNSYKLTITFKKWYHQSNYFVVRDEGTLKRIVQLLEERNIPQKAKASA